MGTITVTPAPIEQSNQEKIQKIAKGTYEVFLKDARLASLDPSLKKRGVVLEQLKKEMEVSIVAQAQKEKVALSPAQVKFMAHIQMRRVIEQRAIASAMVEAKKISAFADEVYRTYETDPKNTIEELLAQIEQKRGCALSVSQKCAIVNVLKRLHGKALSLAEIEEGVAKEIVRGNEAFSLTVKDGLTNIAIRNQKINKTLLVGTTSFTAARVALAIGGLVVAILTMAALLCPPVGALVLFTMTLATAALFSASLIYQKVTRPHVFKEAYGSLDGWLRWFDQLKSKFYHVRLDRARAEMEVLKKKMAPELMGTLHRQIVSGKESASHASELALYTGVQKKIESLEKLSSQADARIESMERRMKEAYQKDLLTLLQKDRDWADLEKLIQPFEEAIVLQMREGNQLCPDLMAQVAETIGLTLDLDKMKALAAQCQMNGVGEKSSKAAEELSKYLHESIREFIFRER